MSLFDDDDDLLGKPHQGGEPETKARPPTKKNAGTTRSRG